MLFHVPGKKMEIYWTRTLAGRIDQLPKRLWKFIVSRAYHAKVFGLETVKYIDAVWEMTETWEKEKRAEIRSLLTGWEIENNAYLGRELFQDKVNLHFDDPQRRRALEAYKNWDLDGCVGFLRKGIDGFITTTAGSLRDGLPYRVRVLEGLADGSDVLMLLGARLAAGSPRVYVEFQNENVLEAIRVSIDPQAPKILEGDEKDCPGADFTDIFAFIKKCYWPLIDHWDGIIDSSELRRRVRLILEG